jgi:hypothetical protein
MTIDLAPHSRDLIQFELRRLQAGVMDSSCKWCADMANALVVQTVSCLEACILPHS